MRIALIKGGIVHNVIEAAPGWAEKALPGYDTYLVSDVAGPGDTWDGQTFTRPAPEPPSLSVPISRLAFRRRFTNPEWKALYQLAKREIDLEMLLEDLRLATSVTLTDPSMIAALQGLGAAGLLTPARVAEILTTAPRPHEVA